MKTEKQILERLGFIEAHKDMLNQAEWPKPTFIISDVLKWVLSDN